MLYKKKLSEVICFYTSHVQSRSLFELMEAGSCTSCVLDITCIYCVFMSQDVIVMDRIATVSSYKMKLVECAEALTPL